MYVLQVGALKPLCDLLVVDDSKTILVILDAVSNMLNVCTHHNCNLCVVLYEVLH